MASGIPLLGIQLFLSGRGPVIENMPLARKLGAFVALSGAEISVLEGLRKRRRTFVAGPDLVHQGQSDQSAYMTAPLAADLDYTLKGKEEELQAALTALGKLTPGKVHVSVTRSDLKLMS